MRHTLPQRHMMLDVDWGEPGRGLPLEYQVLSDVVLKQLVLLSMAHMDRPGVSTSGMILT